MVKSVPKNPGTTSCRSRLRRRAGSRRALAGEAPFDPAEETDSIHPVLKAADRRQQDGRHHPDAADPQHHADDVQGPGRDDLVHFDSFLVRFLPRAAIGVPRATVRRLNPASRAGRRLRLSADRRLRCRRPLRYQPCRAREGPNGVEIRAFLRRLVRAIRGNWPQVAILVRADSHYACPQGRLDWCEANGIDYVFGLAPTSTWKRHVGVVEGDNLARSRPI